MSPEEIEVDRETFAVSVERERVKNVNARLRGSRVLISAPHHISEKDLKPMVEELAHKLIRRERTRQINEEENALALVRKVARRFPDPSKVEHVIYSANQRLRWGSYSSRTRTIRLSAALRRMPGWVLEAVIAHELAHVYHPNHSPKFWGLLKDVCPETERANAFLEGVSWLGDNLEHLPAAEKEMLIKDRGEKPGRSEE